MQSYSLAFELNELPPSLNVFMRWHYRKRHKEFCIIEKNCLAHFYKRLPETPLSKYQITFTRHTIRPLDIDNLVASFKPILDSLVKGRVIEDDKWDMSEHIKYRQEKVSKRILQKVTILVSEVVE